MNVIAVTAQSQKRLIVAKAPAIKTAHCEVSSRLNFVSTFIRFLTNFAVTCLPKRNSLP